MTTDPGREPLHFEENLLGDGDAAALLRRGDDQLVFMGQHHPFVTMFAKRVQPCPAPHPSTLKQAKLKDVIAVLGSVCGKSVPPLDHKIIDKFITPQALESRLKTAMKVIAVQPYSTDTWRQLCEFKLPPLIERLRIEESDLGDCQPHVQDLDQPDTLIEPVVAHFRLMEQTNGSELMHAYAEFTDIVGSHYTTTTQTSLDDNMPGPKALMAAKILEEAARECKQRVPKDHRGRAKLLYSLLEKSLRPQLFCRKHDEQRQMSDYYDKPTIYRNRLKSHPEEDMLNLVCDIFEHVLYQPVAADLKVFVHKFSGDRINQSSLNLLKHQTSFRNV